MEMQERAAPAGISTVVRDLDPSAERVIMRCLQPDPRQRPASAMAVAAALPGGDPLAAALAAGETPSPELVAAAGETEGLEPRFALGWLSAALLLVAAAMVLGPRVSITSKLDLENSPDALTRDARAHLRSFGYTTKPADSAWGLEYAEDYKKYAARHPAEADARWRNPSAGQPPLVQFWYRESPQPLSAERQFHNVVDYDDPPFTQSGMLRLATDPDGKLISFESVPPQVEKPALPVPPFDWNKLFQAAGLDSAQFQTSEPTWTPLANWDSRAAWTGTDPATGAKLRIEAAAWRGRPVFFRIIGPWTVPSRMTPAGNTNSVPFMTIIYIALIAGCVLGWHNLRTGKADLRGATTLSAIYFACLASAKLLTMHHTATVGEINGFWTAIGSATVNAAINWIFYVALEPWVRRKWPRTMISWTRYTSTGASDPLVGRDLLYGTALGALLTLGNVADVAFHGNNGHPAFPPLDALLGVRAELSGVIASVRDAIFTAMLFFFMLFLLRLLLRKEWIAGAAFVVIVTFASQANTTTPWVDYPLGALAFAIFAIALLRFGLLAAIVTSAVGQILDLGGMLDFSAWYSGMAFMPFLLILLVLVYGFRVSLGGRKLLKQEL
jgi:serine/threonine-protein kinase